VPLAGVNDETADLVRAALGGDREAFGGLVERNWNRLVRLARSVVGELEAEDAVQDGLVAAWGRLATLAEPRRFDTWVSRIVFRRCLRASRRQRGRVSLEAVAEPNVTCDPAASLAAWQLLSRLAPRQRAVLHLTVVEGMTDAEIAPLLAITPASVRSHRRRARESVARLMQGGKP
jgi:RNA polymerase sigma-70 factor, ECF subfamily